MHTFGDFLCAGFYLHVLCGDGFFKDNGILYAADTYINAESLKTTF